MAKITPVFKKGPPRLLAQVIIAPLEYGIKDRLFAHLLKCDVINANQHGFLTRKSTTTHLLESCYDWIIALDTKRSVDIV